ncbi:MAG: hypothetical protein O8C61_08645 [Candidatus Methanoperedens sp.]|nr:hypothetical protein [Candidatus Methanoperedens sp.]
MDFGAMNFTINWNDFLEILLVTIIIYWTLLNSDWVLLTDIELWGFFATVVSIFELLDSNSKWVLPMLIFSVGLFGNIIRRYWFDLRITLHKEYLRSERINGTLVDFEWFINIQQPTSTSDKPNRIHRKCSVWLNNSPLWGYKNEQEQGFKLDILTGDGANFWIPKNEFPEDTFYSIEGKVKVGWWTREKFRFIKRVGEEWRIEKFLL